MSTLIEPPVLKTDEMRAKLAQLEALRHLIEHVAHYLPAQGPITAFVHHNTLHAFEELPFEEAVLIGAKAFKCHPYLPEDRYRQELARGRISPTDLEAVLIDDLGDHGEELIGFLGTRFSLRMAMLEFPFHTGPVRELRWVIEESDALWHFRAETPDTVRDQVVTHTQHWVMRDLRDGRHLPPTDPDRRIREHAHRLLELFSKPAIEEWDRATWEAFTLHLLWMICRDGVAKADDPLRERPEIRRHRDWLWESTGEDTDRLVQEVLIRFCAAFLDQGFADWPLPNREQGFYRSFIEIYSQPGGPPVGWMRKLQWELGRLSREQIEPLESIRESLEILGVGEDAQEDFITQSLLALRGFAGMIWQTETRGDRVVRATPQGSLIDFLAIELLLERYALAYVAKEKLGFEGPLRELFRSTSERQSTGGGNRMAERAYLVFQLAQVRGWKPEELYSLSKPYWNQLVKEMESFSSRQRRRIYHSAYERQFNTSLLDAISVQTERTSKADSTPVFQLCCCIDDREESFRRHLEEVAPNCETFGFAGFFAVAMYYRGAADAHYFPLCPVTIKPQHYVREIVSYTFEESHRRRSALRRVLGTAIHGLHLGSRTILGGMLTGVLGAVASIPLVARILMPRTTAQTRKLFGHLVRAPHVTQMTLERKDPEPGPENGHLGYTLDEMAGIVGRVLKDIGLTANFSSLVIFTGHGSSSLNNPHESAYNCGACAGGRGGPNARAFARIANDLRVREKLQKTGLAIPNTTIFLGAYHNTCDDSYTFFDLEQLPATHRDDFDHATRCIDQARQRNAHERCRRFESAKLTLTPQEALRHVEGRAEDLSQVRPEYNHATNAVTIVGRRWRFRGLFLDRRAFLCSYDPLQDDANFTVLERILQPAVPVCAGISLEYYFSCVDPEGWGCGSKLPHNVTSLLGVMAGAASDLRPGLSQQMIEIHEPLRQIFVVETTPEAMLRIMEDNAGIRNLIVNRWVYLTVLDPQSSQLQIFRRGKFEPYYTSSRELPTVPSSESWYRGWRDHLGFASIVLPKTIDGTSSVPTTMDGPTAKYPQPVATPNSLPKTI